VDAKDGNPPAASEPSPDKHEGKKTDGRQQANDGEGRSPITRAEQVREKDRVREQRNDGAEREVDERDREGESPADGGCGRFGSAVDGCLPSGCGSRWGVPVLQHGRWLCAFRPGVRKFVQGAPCPFVVACLQEDIDSRALGAPEEEGKLLTRKGEVEAVDPTPAISFGLVERRPECPALLRCEERHVQAVSDGPQGLREAIEMGLPFSSGCVGAKESESRVATPILEAQQLEGPWQEPALAIPTLKFSFCLGSEERDDAPVDLALEQMFDISRERRELIGRKSNEGGPEPHG